MFRDIPPLLLLLGAAWIGRHAGLPGGPVMVGTAVCLLLSGVRLRLQRRALADGYGSAEPRHRFARRALTAVEWLAALVFATAALGPLLDRRVPALLAVGGAVALLGAGVLAARRRRTPPPVGEERHWLAGALYLNRADPAVLVPQRLGPGLTVNLGRPLGWVLLLAPLAGASLLAWWLARRL
ncbi:MAG: hypothetical protein HZB56_14295 [Deltaproteobacteria bacterium]|nr:hypothetical protein [Deltaproteobacteria bacterium]